MTSNPILDSAASRVGIACGEARYDAAAPFSPDPSFPETRPLSAGGRTGGNGVHATVRDSLRLLGLDAARYGTAQWNPLGAVVGPGDSVVIKPNFVRDFRESSRDDGECLITHGSVLRAVIDYVYLALGGR